MVRWRLLMVIDSWLDNGCGWLSNGWYRAMLKCKSMDGYWCLDDGWWSCRNAQDTTRLGTARLGTGNSIYLFVVLFWVIMNIHGLLLGHLELMTCEVWYQTMVQMDKQLSRQLTNLTMTSPKAMGGKRKIPQITLFWGQVTVQLFCSKLDYLLAKPSNSIG